MKVALDRFTAHGVERMVEGAAANNAHIIVALRIGMIRYPCCDTRIETRARGSRRIFCQRFEGLCLGENNSDLGLRFIKLFGLQDAQAVKPCSRCKALRLADSFQRTFNIFLKVGQERRLRRVKPLTKDPSRGFEGGGLRAFEMPRDLVEGLLNTLIFGCRRHHARGCKAGGGIQDLFKIILSGVIVAVRTVAVTRFGLHEIPVDLGFGAPDMRSEIDKRGKSSELGDSAAKLGLRSHLNERQQPRHDRADTHRNRIDGEDRKVGRRFFQLSPL